MSHGGRWLRYYEGVIGWLVHRTPAPMLVNPERVALKTAVALIGLVSLVFIRPTSLNALLPQWTVYVWGVSWFLGGCFGLYGYWHSNRPIEAAGHRFIILGAVVYATSIGVVIGAPGFAAIAMIAVLAFCSVIRLLIAAAAKLSRRRGQ